MQDSFFSVVPNPAPAALPVEAKPSPKRRRGRAMGPPFHEVLYAQSGRKIDVRIEVPAPDEECPLSLAPIAEDTLEFLQPTTSYVTAFPDAKKMILPCGHGFGALSILYHFARRNMLCPCCRAGLDSRLAPHCVPTAFRKTFLSRVQRELRSDSEEMAESDRRLASSLDQSQAMSLVYVVDLRFTRADPVLSFNFDLTACFIGYNESRPPVATFSLPLVPRENVDDRWLFAVPNGVSRTFFDLQLTDPSVCGVRLGVTIDGGPEIARSGLIAFDREQNRNLHAVNAEGNSCFYLEVHGGASRVYKLEWVVPVSYLEVLQDVLPAREVD